MMPVTLGGVIVPVVVVVVPGARSRVVEDDIGAQATVEVGWQDRCLDPGSTGIVMIIAPLVVVVDAHGGVKPKIICDRSGSRPWVVGSGPHHAPTQAEGQG